MGYHPSNAAFAYDMDGNTAYMPQPVAPEVPQVAERPHLDVYTGNGRQADQDVSPVFTHVIMVCSVMIALFFVFGFARIALASATASELNAAAAVSTTLSSARDSSADLEVMSSVYGSDARIRDLAKSTLGMVDPEDTVTLDLSGTASSAATAQ